jgi:hypothetical protein
MDIVARLVLLGQEREESVQQRLSRRRDLLEILPLGPLDAQFLEHRELWQEARQLAAVVTFLLPPQDPHHPQQY